MDRILKVAFIGGGVTSVVGPAHYSAINIDNNYELVAGTFSRNQLSNKQSGEFYRVKQERVYSRVDELLINEKNYLDAIIILTPTDQHYANVLSVIKCGIPVICEKSLGSSVEELLELKTFTEERNGFLTVIYNYLGYPMVRELRSIIQNGSMGRVSHIQVEMPLENYALFDSLGNPLGAQEWRLNDGILPTISLDLGVHLHMLIKYLTNEQPLRVISKSSSIGNHTSVIDNVNCIIEYSSGLSCNMWFSKIALGSRNGMKIRLYGDEGSAEWVQEIPEIIKMADKNGKKWILDRGSQDIAVANQKRYARFKVGHPVGFIEAFANYYHDIAVSLMNYKNNKTIDIDECFGVDEALEGLKLFEAVQKSSSTMSWEDV